MISGGRILWNAFAVCEMTKTFWQTGDLKRTKIWWILPGHALFAGGIWEEDILAAEIEELEKLDASETYPRRLNAKEVLKEVLNYQEETTNSKNPLWDGNPPSGERISAENLTAMEKSFDLKNQKMTQKLGKTFWSFQGYFIYRHHIEPRVQLKCQEKNHSLFHKIYIIEQNSSEKKYTIQRRDWRKAKTSEAKKKQIQLYWYCRERTEFCTLLTLRTNSFRWKDPKEALHLIAFASESEHMLSRLAAQHICETKFFK